MILVRGLLLLVAVALATGCISSRTIHPGEARDIAGEYRVTSEAKWTRTGWRNLEVWTVDGPQLQQLRLYAEIEDGETLFERPRQAILVRPSVRKYRPKYHHYMAPHDVMELVTATLVKWGAVDAVGSNLRPAALGGRDGFRFDIRFVSQGGLVYRGLAHGSIDAERNLHLVLYLGTEAHYFPKFLQEVEDILSSIQWIG